jgi:hypothetical protein
MAQTLILSCCRIGSQKLLGLALGLYIATGCRIERCQVRVRNPSTVQIVSFTLH